MSWNRTVIAAAVPVAAVAVCAGIQSYSHIEQLALRTSEPLVDARLLPLSLDGLIVAGVVIILAGSWRGWICVVPGVAGTLFANLAWGLPHGHLSAAVATWPAIAFSVACYVVERWIKSQVTGVATGGQEVATDSEKKMADRPSFPEVPATLEPVPATPRPCGHVLAGDPADVVVADYLHTRDCLGETPSQRHLADTHGVSRHKVAALVGPLNGTGQPG